ncbi:hypothetical protein ABZ667_38585 [Streptomyces lavendulae]
MTLALDGDRAPMETGRSTTTSAVPCLACSSPNSSRSSSTCEDIAAIEEVAPYGAVTGDRYAPEFMGTQGG